MAVNHTIILLQSEPRLTSGNLQIIACAGSGKTEFVSTRITYILAEKMALPENIVAFTFTERAAEELKFRIRSKMHQIIGHQPDVGDMYVGTIHSFCFELLKEYVPGYQGYDVLDEGKRYAFLASIYRDIGGKELQHCLESMGRKAPYGTTNQTWVINTLKRGLDIAREEMLNFKDVSVCNEFYQATEIYERKLDERRFLDFSGMLARTVHVLENESAILKEVRKRYTYLTVDEYQDINPIQERLIELLAGKNGNLCVVGDDDQAIYQWRGSNINNILTFPKRHQNVYIHYLPINFRSTDNIIRLGNELICRNQKRLLKDMKNHGEHSQPGDIYKLNFRTQAEEVSFIVDRIKYLVGTEWQERDGKKRGLAYSDFAIFFRSIQYDSQPYLDAFTNAGIPYVVSGVGGLFEAPEVDLVFSIFAYLGDFEKIWDGTARQGYVPTETDIFSFGKDLFPLPSEQKFIQILQELKIDIDNRRRLSLQALYTEVLLLLGIYNEELHDEDHEIQMFNLGRLSQAISDYENTRSYCTKKDISGFCWFIRHYAEGSYDAGAGDDPTLGINAVQVMTLHGTKGLGFPAVFMPFCVDRNHHDHDPGFLDPTKINLSRYSGSEEDERRLFYVGLTRAKKYLYITTSHDPGYRKRKKSPSRFFLELNDKYCLTKPDPDPIKRKRRKSEPWSEEFRFPTSYSELSDYIRCEYDYKMRYIYGFNPGVVQALGYGRQIHNVLNILHKIAQESGDIPTDIQAAQVLNQHFYLRYAAEQQAQTLKISAMQSVLRYLNMWKDDFSLSLKTERTFELEMDNAIINGSIDLLKRKDTGNNILEIIDFKTGNERKMSEELALQVQLYTIAAREALNLNVDKAYVHFLDEKKQNRVEVLTTPTQLKLARQAIGDAIGGITSRRFYRNPKNKKTCATCDWGMICPKK